MPWPVGNILGSISMCIRLVLAIHEPRHFARIFRVKTNSYNQWKFTRFSFGNFFCSMNCLFVMLGCTVRVSSIGNSKLSPHCSSESDCKYDENTQQQCANALCNAQGYLGGIFVESSNNFCNSSYTSGIVFAYVIDKDEISSKKFQANAKTSADCIPPGNIIFYQHTFHTSRS